MLIWWILYIRILKVSAIFSDSDGTLVPAQVGNSMANTIPNELEKELWNVAYNIPVCIISSKDYYFLKDKVRFSKILSCIIGIEIINKMKTKENEYYAANDASRIRNSNIMLTFLQQYQSSWVGWLTVLPNALLIYRSFQIHRHPAKLLLRRPLISSRTPAKPFPIFFRLSHRSSWCV